MRRPSGSVRFTRVSGPTCWKRDPFDVAGDASLLVALPSSLRARGRRGGRGVLGSGGRFFSGDGRARSVRRGRRRSRRGGRALHVAFNLDFVEETANLLDARPLFLEVGWKLEVGVAVPPPGAAHPGGGRPRHGGPGRIRGPRARRQARHPGIVAGATRAPGPCGRRPRRHPPQRSIGRDDPMNDEGGAPLSWTSPHPAGTRRLAARSARAIAARRARAHALHDRSPRDRNVHAARAVCGSG